MMFRGRFSGASRANTQWPGDAPKPECTGAIVPAVDWQGEIHNAAELCADLGLTRGTPVESMLLAGWQRWGAGLLPRLDGVFAIALRDRETLHLYRDPSGLAALYLYTGSRGEAVYATTLSALLAMQGVTRRLARGSLHEFLRFLDIAAPNTLFESVVAIEAGQLLHWSAKGIHATQPTFSSQHEPSPKAFAEAVEQLDARLQGSVRTRLEDSKRPAAFLSGGVDSALLCALSASHRPDTVTVTVGFDDAAYDESTVAEGIASHLGLTHEVLRFSRSQYLGAFERLAAGLGQPMADPATMATLLAFEHCRSRHDVVIDGTGADEAVGAMPSRHVRVAVQYGSLLPPVARRLLVRAMRATPVLAERAALLDFDHPADTMARWKGFTRQEIEVLCGEAVSFRHTHFYDVFQRFPREAHFDRYSALLNAMPCERLTQAQALSGLRVRYPFADPAVCGFIRQLPTDWRYTPAQPKRILRALLARYVPAQLWDLPKHGFNFPLAEFLAADDFALLQQHLDTDRWPGWADISAKAVRSYRDRFMAGDRSLSFRVWALVVLGAWLAAHEPVPSSST